MISQDNLMLAIEEMKAVVDKYAKSPLDEIILTSYMKFLTEQTASAGSMKDIFGLELKK